MQPSYGISRPYPYKWFLPVSVAVVVVTIAVFSWLNYIASAYTLGILSTADPNATLASYNWLQQWPSYFTSQFQPQCQPQLFQINSEFFTNQTALMYTITDIWNATDPNNRLRTPAFIYQNQPLHSCTVDTIQVDFAAEDRTAAQYGWAMWGETVTAFVSCTIENNSTVWTFNMTSQYDFVPPTAGMPLPASRSYEANVTSSFLATDPKNKASLWWGESLLSTYWTSLAWQIEHIREKGNSTVNNLRKGTVYFKRHNLLNPIMDITNPDFWDVDYRFITNEINAEGILIPAKKQLAGWMPYTNLTLSELIEQEIDPDIWELTDGLAKSLYSCILTDLGQTSTMPNILLNASALQFFTANFSRMREHVDNAYPGPDAHSFDEGQDETGPLGTTPSVIATSYMCQVPVEKSSGSIVLSIFLADLVFVQAVWKLLNFLVTTYLHYKHPEANSCLGCNCKAKTSPSDLGPGSMIPYKPVPVSCSDPEPVSPLSRPVTPPT